jgi:mannosyltransferase
MSLRITKESIPIVLLGTMFTLAAFLLPETWHIDAVIPAGSVSSPDKNLIIARICCSLDGLWCLYIGLTGWHWHQLSANSLIVPKRIDEIEETISRRLATGLLLAIVLVALFLRCLYLDTSFWLDEITPLTFYRDSSVFGLLTTYFSTNNHLLYTLLEKLAVTGFGEREWAVRMPSVLFGVASVPVLYLLTRLIANRWVSLGTAFLLAVSYHHIFFSQNARGYTAHLFFTLAATLFLIRGIKKDKVAHWACYCACMFLNLASIIASLSVLIAHFLIAVIAAFVVQKRGGAGWPLFRRLAAVIFLALLLVLHLYSIIFPQAYMVVQNTYHIQSTGFTLFSAEFAAEIARGLKLASGPLVLIAAIPAILISAIGLRMIFKCSWILLAGLILPEILLAAYLLKLSLAVSPRFFLLALPFALLVCSVGFYACMRLILNRLNKAELLTPLFLGGMFCVAAVNIPALCQYYRMPKQDFRTAVSYLQSKPSKVYPVSIYTAREGFAYYAKRIGWRQNIDFFDTRTVPDFNAILQTHKPGELYLVTTFPRALHLDHPELESLIEKYWTVDKVFPGSIGDGDLTVWKPR